MEFLKYFVFDTDRFDIGHEHTELLKKREELKELYCVLETKVLRNQRVPIKICCSVLTSYQILATFA